MRTIPIYQVDAFTTEVFKGNPAAVCPLETWLPEETMQRIAQENNLAETAFYVRTEINGEVVFEIRWFTPTVEVDLCGHATLAAAHIIFENGFDSNTITFASKNRGRLTVKRINGIYQLDFPTDTTSPIDVPPAIYQALGAPCEEAFQGLSDIMVVVENQKTLESLAPDFAAIAKLDIRGVIVTAKGDKVDFVSRCFFPGAGINEDPVTGSAHTTMAPYWAKRLGKISMRAEQRSARRGQLDILFEEDRTKISGSAITYLEGSIFF